MTNKFVSPIFNGASFTCPHCDVLAKQDWSQLCAGNNWTVYKATCQHCNQISLWFGDWTPVNWRYYAKNCKMFYPRTINVPLPNDDLEEEIKQDYLEAAKIVQDSPRGACALLRLALQKLMIQLWESGTDINKDIGELVTKGLSLTIQKALDTVRVIGNESIHPWILDLKDDHETANKMFGLINIISNYLITQPKEIEWMYWDLPPEKLDWIKKRDKKKEEKSE